MTNSPTAGAITNVDLTTQGVLPPATTNRAAITPPVEPKAALSYFREKLVVPAQEELARFQKNCTDIGLDADRTSRHDYVAKKLNLDPKTATDKEIFSKLLGVSPDKINNATLRQAFGTRHKENVYQYAAAGTDFEATKTALTAVYKLFLDAPVNSLPAAVNPRRAPFAAACNQMEIDPTKATMIGLAAYSMGKRQEDVTPELLKAKFGEDWRSGLIKIALSRE